MSSSTKRKGAPGGQRDGQWKKKKGGNDGKWKTSHQQTKEGHLQEGIVSPGEVGIWVSCARGQEGKAARDVVALFDEYAQLLYNAKPPGEAPSPGPDAEEEDIEASIKRELASLKATGKEAKLAGHIFTPIKMNVACLLFVRTRAPVEPVGFVRRICQDARVPGLQRTRSRYVNRLVPMSAVGRASEAGLVETAREVLGGVFDLSGKKGLDEGKKGEEGGAEEKEKEGEDVEGVEKKAADGQNDGQSEDAPPPPVAEVKQSFSFAIRPSIRNNHTLKRDVIINRIACLINNERHKVALDSPDKVILVEVYQNACGISVVDGDYMDGLKKYNLSELYGVANNQEEQVREA